MPRKPTSVTVQDVDPAKLPDTLVPGALLLHDLEERGLVEELGKRLKIRRQGGYAAVDVFLALLLYIASGSNKGFRLFYQDAGHHFEKAAALAGRRRLPSPASASRALDAVEEELLRPATHWLLTDLPRTEALLQHPVAQTYDANGDGWHVFDIDPTVTTIRHRALPVDEDLPEGVRRSRDLGAPGHAGRKRGDIQFRRVDVQHAGTGLFVHAHLHAGNGHGVADLGLALDGIAKVVDRLGHARHRAVVRMDGEFGNVPFFAACRERDFPFLTRLNRSKLYEDPAVLRRLGVAEWYLVPDSKSGPVRAAADLGVLTVRPDRRTRRADGSHYEPVKIRVVASIFPIEGEAKRGSKVDGYQVELFAADLPADAWPAPEVVATYFGRSGQENRLAQEDREVGLDRILSYHLPGQELATLVGLFLMNYRTVRGFELEPPPHERPTPTLRRATVDTRRPATWPRDPVIGSTLDALKWEVLLAKWQGWTWDHKRRVLRCPDGRPLELTTVRTEPHAAGHVIFRRPANGCETCDQRPSCFSSGRPQAAKHAQIALPKDVAAKLGDRLAKVRAGTSSIELEPIDVPPGLRAVISPRFLPAAARQRYSRSLVDASVQVNVKLPPDRKPGPQLLADGVADRQHRRKTWAERVAWNALPDAAQIWLHVEAHADLRSILASASRCTSMPVEAAV